MGKNEAVTEAVRKPPLKFAIVLGKDFVQMIAKVSSGFMASGIQAILHFGAEQRILSCTGKACKLPCSSAARYPSRET